MTVGVVTARVPAHAIAPPPPSSDEAAALLEEVRHSAQQIIQMAQSEASKPAAAVNLPRLRRMAEEMSETYDLLRVG